MSAVTVGYALLFYAASAVFALGVARKIYIYARTPQPLKIPTTPAPVTRLGVAGRMLREVTLFESLFKSNKWIWLFGWVFHFALLLVLARHLRYFTEPVWGWVVLIQPFGVYAGFAMVAGLAGLWARRVLVDRVRYISNPSDHLMLALLAGIAASGLGLKFATHTDIIAFKAFVLGLMYFDWQPLPADPLLLAHLTLVAILMIVFPVSKLLHAPGVFFSPTRNQADNPREHRHVAGWSAEIESPVGRS
ncbi:MAG: nitrate reductase [Candidatus Muproteobacteria bacterium RIFCSPHIGHO2_01_FULL_65_16]|uniref:Nitrate reductase n=1 Tax=Candidatus Muproteobacteria bacterium RIFCSPHIGHO2_01_FULL_65_16 TaxID=1817764 RepID=A0A1F6THP9_9PROT|nr:MAG: nitrate reductase [Candidatus Muproteobacteria bacterium RIFCSPHIGHO2_01_FULL_65_16]